MWGIGKGKVDPAGTGKARTSRKDKYEEEVVAYLGIYDHSGHIPALIPLRRMDIHAKTLEFTIDGEEYELEHANPFQILGKKVRETIYLCREGATACDNPEIWFKKYHTEGSFTGYTIEQVHRLVEIKNQTREQFSTMKNLGLLVIVGASLMMVGILCNVVLFHAGYPHIPVPPPPTNSTQAIYGVFN